MKHLLILLILVGFSSCAYFDERFDAAGKCASDPTCLASVQEKAKVARAMADASGFPWAGPVASVALTGIMLFFAKRRKKDGEA